MAGHSAAYERFMASTDIDYERWHDGVPYDLDAIGELRGAERAEVEQWLLTRAGSDWRDLEGLLALGTEHARSAVVNQLRYGSIEMRLAAARRLPPDPAIEAAREAAIVDGLATSTVMDGLTTAIDLATEHPTPNVIDALFRAALRDDHVMAVHAAALLMYLHGNAKEPFDWDRRPLYLQFGDDDPKVRRVAFEQLCRECGVDPQRYLGGAAG
jgi:hypothetical protein